MRPEDARRLLGVPSSASDHDVERAFRRAVRTEHPDAGGDPDRFRAFVTARASLLRPREWSHDRDRLGAERSVVQVRHSLRTRLWRAVRHRLPNAPSPRVR